MRALLVFVSIALAGGCSPADVVPDAGESPGDGDSGLADAGAPDAGSKAESCASQFGDQLTAAFGRLDGTLVAVVAPSDTQCALPNSDHLVVQVQMNGAVYRVVVNILSDGRNNTDTRLRYQELPHALTGGAWTEGWHAGAALDYPTSLGAHSDAGFTPYAMNDLVQKVSDRLVLGAKVSAFTTSSGGAYAGSAHLVHRNPGPPSADGALVVDPDSADPLFLLFFFDGLTF